MAFSLKKSGDTAEVFTWKHKLPIAMDNIQQFFEFNLISAEIEWSLNLGNDSANCIEMDNDKPIGIYSIGHWNTLKMR